jgi:hypothetical protein
VWNWAKHRRDTAMTARLSSFTRNRILGADMDSWCPLPVDGEPENFEFIPPCLQRAMTVLAVVPDQLSNPWLKDFVAAQDQLQPLRNARLATHGSLNFSRAWGLWSLYRATGKGEYQDMYVAHMESQLGDMAQAKKHGQGIDPWQATFGVYALAISYEG